MLHIKGNRFGLKDVEGIFNLARVCADYFPNPEHYLTAIYELLINAVEHGNLGIGFNEKAALVAEGKWKQELSRRLSLPENLEKDLTVIVENVEGECKLTICDQGEGFDWRSVIEKPVPATQVNGRGLQIAFNAGFNSIVYNDKGNQVTCVARYNES